MPALSASATPGRSARADVGAWRACPNDVRGPAPSNNSQGFLAALLSATWLLRLLCSDVGLVLPAFLLWLVPPGVAACPGSRSPLPTAASPGVSSPTTTAASRRVARF